MSVPLPPFLLFFGFFLVVGFLVVAKTRAEARQQGPGTQVPPAHVATAGNSRLTFSSRCAAPSAYPLAIGFAALASVVVCLGLSFYNSRPEPSARSDDWKHTTVIEVDPVNGTSTSRPARPNEQLQTIGEGLRELVPQNSAAIFAVFSQVKTPTFVELSKLGWFFIQPLKNGVPVWQWIPRIMDQTDRDAMQQLSEHAHVDVKDVRILQDPTLDVTASNITEALAEKGYAIYSELGVFHLNDNGSVGLRTAEH